MLPEMASRTPTPRTLERHTWAQPIPTRPPRKRFRRTRRFIRLAIVLAIVAVAAWVYLMHDYAPGLRAEAATIPTLVREQLAQQNAAYTPRTQISVYLQQAIVSIEDRRFYSTPGIDPIGTVRAMWVDLTRKHIDQGGSTLEEQLVKRTLVPDDRSIHGKLRTAVVAWAVDQDFSKPKIIELYLNAAYFGQGAYGVGEAAHVYFGTDAAHLTLSEAAFLAALPQAPSIYGAHPTAPAVRQRYETVLQDMQQQGYITSGQQETAARTPLTFTLPNP